MTGTTLAGRKGRGPRARSAFPALNALGMALLMFVTLYPVLNTVAISLNDGTDAIRGGIGLLPRVFSIKSYETIFADEIIYNAFFITIARTAIQTVLNVVLTAMLSFALSRREYVLRRLITTAMVVTMYVNAGLIPNYLLIQRTLGLGRTFWVYIVPTMFSCFNMIVMRTYILGLPEALVESGRIDGAGDFYLFWRIIFPLMLPVAATVALFVAVGAWNSWFDTHLYNAGKVRLHTLQYLLKMKLATTTNSANAAMTTADAASSTTLTTPVTIRAAITVVSAAPIMAIYPFLQRYFVVGLSVGSIKG
ncbi:MAG TPA: carbohydrate ABC transporter permease [Candidatus Limnocylindria bacterium]|nr:carbohydrate ABC transporter permease [Candidatus Limnocylindria bacterium]